MLPYVYAGGEKRYLANHHAPMRYAWKRWGDDGEKMPIIPRSEWKPIDLSQYVSPIKDQNGVGACNAFATCNVIEACRRMAGLPDATLSPGHLYGRINGGVDNGSMLEDAIETASREGVCLASTVPELEWHKARWPASAADEALSYRIEEWAWCPTFDALASALQKGFLLNLGILWYENYEPDSKGWLPARGQGMPGGHAICACALEQDGSRWGLKIANTWTPKWGMDGFAIVPESATAGPVGGWWACRTTIAEGGQIPAPAV